MENASKALEIAGVVLITVVVIAALIFMFREIAGTRSNDAKNAELERVTQFNKSFESFVDKEISGIEIFSIVNKIEDYNKSNDVKYEGYTSITLNVKKEQGGFYVLSDLSGYYEKMKNIKSRYRKCF